MSRPSATKEIERRYDELYEKYGKPLEAEHEGKYLAVTVDGRAVLGEDLRQVAQEATATSVAATSSSRLVNGLSASGGDRRTTH